MCRWNPKADVVLDMYRGPDKILGTAKDKRVRVVKKTNFKGSELLKRQGFKGQSDKNPQLHRWVLPKETLAPVTGPYTYPPEKLMLCTSSRSVKSPAGKEGGCIL
jgi:hypothetical protein